MRILAILVAVTAIACGVATAQTVSPDAVLVDDGDTIRVGANIYRLVGFDAPETQKAKCAAELALGNRATARLRDIVRRGGLDLIEVECSCRPGTHGTRSCNYGRLCATLKARGEDVGVTSFAKGSLGRFIAARIAAPSDKDGVSRPASSERVAFRLAGLRTRLTRLWFIGGVTSPPSRHQNCRNLGRSCKRSPGFRA